MPFDTPKPVELTKQIIRTFLPDDGGLVVDFFAGSGTVGHASMELAQAGLPVRSLSMQWPEALEDTAEQRAGLLFCRAQGLPETVFSITLERLRRVAKATGSLLQVWG